MFQGGKDPNKPVVEQPVVEPPPEPETQGPTHPINAIVGELDDGGIDDQTTLQKMVVYAASDVIGDFSGQGYQRALDLFQTVIENDDGTGVYSRVGQAIQEYISALDPLNNFYGSPFVNSSLSFYYNYLLGVDDGASLGVWSGYPSGLLTYREWYTQRRKDGISAVPNTAF